MTLSTWRQALRSVQVSNPRRARWSLGRPAEVLEARLAPAAAVRVHDIRPGNPASNPYDLTDFNGTLYFTADDGSNGTELWKTDGTPEGTVLVKDIRPGTESSSPGFLTVVNDTLYFSADDGTNGHELWKTDGTPDGTVLVQDIRPGTQLGLNGSEPRDLVNFNGTLVFTADSGPSFGRELWKSDGGGTVMVKDIRPNGLPSGPHHLANINGTLFFGADDGTNTGLWKSDGTADGTGPVRDVYVSGDFNHVGGTTYFVGGDGQTGSELWKTDGTPEGTVLVKDIHPGDNFNDSHPEFLTDVKGTLFFTATDGPTGIELWKSDGTAGGTVRVKDISPNSGLGSFPQSLTNVNGTLFLAASDDYAGGELWKSDGTKAGTVMVKDIRPLFSSNPLDLVAVGSTLVFAADDGTSGYELWRSDGTAAGTMMVQDLRTGGASSPRYLTNFNGTVYFTADDGTGGRELWKYTPDPVGGTDQKLTDADGDAYSIKLKGPGAVQVFLTDPDGDGTGSIDRIELAGTDPLKSTLTVSVPKPKPGVGDRTVSVGQVTGSGLKALDLSRSILVGAGVNLTGYLGGLKVGDLTNGADIISTGGLATQKTRLTLGAVGDGSEIRLDNAISTLTAARFGAGSITATSAGTLTIKGDFGADLTLSGSGVADGKPALGTLRVTGNILDSAIRVEGDVSLVQAAGFHDSTLFAGYSGAVDGSGTFTRPATVRTFRVTGPADAFANSHVIATAFKSVSLKSVREANAGLKFGFLANESAGTIRVTDPAFRFDPTKPLPPELVDFEVRIV